MICSYCQTESVNTETCDFCKADLTKSRPKINPYLSELDADRTQPELAKMHTYDLLLILSHMRDERTNWYRIMQRIRKSAVEAQISDSDVEFAISEYKRLTAHQRVIEQLLIDRMGYYPQRVDEKLLGALKTKIERCENRERAKRTKRASSPTEKIN